MTKLQTNPAVELLESDRAFIAIYNSTLEKFGKVIVACMDPLELNVPIPLAGGCVVAVRKAEPVEFLRQGEAIFGKPPRGVTWPHFYEIVTD